MIAYLGDTPFRHQFPPDALVAFNSSVMQAKSSSRGMQLFLRGVINGCPHLAPTITAKFLQSEDVLLWAAIEAAKRMRWHKRPTLNRCRSVADSFNCEAPLQEVSRVRAIPKKSGGFRVTHDFNIVHRTAQRVVNTVVAEHFTPRPWQYTMIGARKAIAAAKAQLLSGSAHFATFDLADFFGSFEADKLLQELPLPPEWVNHVVVGRHIAVQADTRLGHAHALSPGALLHLARRGIPQGSACSPAVAAYCVAKLQWHSPAEARLFNYSDNFLLLAPTSEGLQAGIGALAAAIGELPGGHFVLKTVQQGETSAGVEFLGHRLLLKDGQLRASASHAAQQAILRALNELDTKIGASKSAEKIRRLVIQMRDLMHGWLGAFAECDDIADWKQVFDAKIEENAQLTKITPAKLKVIPICDDWSLDDYKYLRTSAGNFDYSLT